MKPLFFLLFLFLCTSLHAQYIYPVVNANFGADAELISNYCNNAQAHSDDWFEDISNTVAKGQGTFIIDTTGAAAIAARYAIDPAYRKLPFYRPMRFPTYSLLSERLIIDGVFIRDYHGDDSTTFAQGGNKNGMSPAEWSAPVAQSVPDKNDIEDMFVHVRRSGNSSSFDLWLFGGVTIIGTTGDRYFDFEMYQTDIFYDRLNRKFIGYGPDEGHTSWTFDTQGNVVKPGDIIFTAEYGTSGLNFIEARIWVNKNALNITPASFSWAKDSQGNFIYDGAANNSQYVYAAIRPKTNINFYSGVQSSAGTWAGPFKFIDAGNNVHDNFTGGEFLEFSVNLTWLGLDSTTLWGNSSCNFPFKRVMAKTRTSTSFGSDLNDFVGPYPIFSVPSVDAQAELSILCPTKDISKINVLNPYSTSVYTWSTPDGNIVDDTQPTSINVNKPGMYIVTQQLMSGCGAYAKDTVTITQDTNCVDLDVKEIRLEAKLKKGVPLLQWTSTINDKTKYYELQRSIDGRSYETIYVQKNNEPGLAQKSYSYRDETVPDDAMHVTYRIKAVLNNGEFTSAPVSLQLLDSLKLSVYPNPAYQKVYLSVSSEEQQNVEVAIINTAGNIVYQQSLIIKKGINIITLDRNSDWTPGMYIVRITSAFGTRLQKLIIKNSK
jgi:hypothetical protein